MKLVFTKTASRQLGDILDYISAHSPSGAHKVQGRILSLCQLLQAQPMAGEATNRAGVRRMVATPYPYIVYYRLVAGTIIVQRVRHGARRPIR